MNIFPETDVDSLDPKNRRQIIGMARELLQGGDSGNILHGLLARADAMKRIWHQIADKSRAFFLGDSVKGPGFVVIHTKVEMIQFTIPRNVLRLIPQK